MTENTRDLIRQRLRESVNTAEDSASVRFRASLKSYPETGRRYRLYSNQTNSCCFFDARTLADAKRHAIGSIGMMVADKTGTLTDLATGESWAIAVEVTALSAEDTSFAPCSRCQAREADMTTADGVATCAGCATADETRNANAAPLAEEVR